MDSERALEMIQVMESLQVLGYDETGFPLANFRGYNLPVYTPLYWNDAYNFDFKSDDVLIASYPKSGNHWISYMAYLLKTKNFGEIPAVLQRPLVELPSPPDQLKKIAKLPSPRVLDTHLSWPLLPKNTFNAKFIYLYRNPKDVVVSAYYHYKNIPMWEYGKSFKEFVHQFMRGHVFWGPYDKHLSEMVKMKNEGKPVFIVRYEDVKKDTRGWIKKLAQFLEVECDDELLEKVYEATTVEAMRKRGDVTGSHWGMGGMFWNQNATFVRKGKVGDWKEHFDAEPDLLAEFEDYIKQKVPAEMAMDYH